MWKEYNTIPELMEAAVKYLKENNIKHKFYCPDGNWTKTDAAFLYNWKTNSIKNVGYFKEK